MQLLKSAWRLLLAIHTRYPGWISFYGGFILLFLSIINGRSVIMPPIICLTGGFLLILFAAVSAYHQLENQKEMLEEGISEIEDRILEVRADVYHRTKGPPKWGFKTVAWIVPDIFITNPSTKYPNGVKYIWLRKQKEGTIVDLSPDKKCIDDKLKNNPFYPTKLLEDNVYLNPSDTKSGGLIFLEMFMDEAAVQQELSEKYNAAIYIEDNRANRLSANLRLLGAPD